MIGARARQFDAELLAALRRKYGLDFVEEEGSQQPSEPSEPSENAPSPQHEAAPKTDTLLTDDRYDLTDEPVSHLSTTRKPITQAPTGRQ